MGERGGRGAEFFAQDGIFHGFIAVLYSPDAHVYRRSPVYGNKGVSN